MGLLYKSGPIKKLEAIGVNMPKFITFRLLWRLDHPSPTYLDVFTTDLEDFMYEYEFQIDMFTFAPLHLFRQWIWDDLCREPVKIEIVEIKF